MKNRQVIKVQSYNSTTYPMAKSHFINFIVAITASYNNWKITVIINCKYKPKVPTNSCFKKYSFCYF
jgi:hypothetical protein